MAAPAETSKKSNEVVERSQNSLSKVKRELIKTQKNPVNIEPRVTLGTFTSGTNTEISPEPSDNVIANKSFGETNPTDVGMEGKKSLNLLPRERQPSIENVMVQEKRNQQTSFETTANRVSDNIRLPQELANDVLVNENSTPSLPAKPDPIQAAFEDNVPDTLSSLPKRKNTEVASITNPTTCDTLPSTATDSLDLMSSVFFNNDSIITDIMKYYLLCFLFEFEKLHRYIRYACQL